MKQGIAVGYPRVSSDGQEVSGYSLDAQVEKIEKFCRDNNLELRAHFLEVESAKTVSARPTFKAALRHLYANNADYLIVTDLDRFSRNVLDSEAIRQSMAKRGKKLISVQQRFFTPLTNDPDDEDELIAARQKASIEAELERKRIKRRMQSGKKAKAARGGWVGHQPWYEVDIVQGRPIINEDRARVIRLMVRLRRVKQTEGRMKDHPMSFNQITAYLNGNNNLPNPDGTKGRIFPPPSARPTLKERRTPRVINSDRWWTASVRKIIMGYEQRRLDILKYAGETRKRA